MRDVAIFLLGVVVGTPSLLASALLLERFSQWREGKRLTEVHSDNVYKMFQEKSRNE